MNRIFHLSDHALCRMERRNVSNKKVAQTIFGGQVFSEGNGKYKAKLWEKHGKTVDEYVVVFSKKENVIITVEHNIRQASAADDEFVSKHRIRKFYKQRKRALREQEFNSWCREEYGSYNLSLPA